MEYTIAAIPTVYRGRKYRSRLEARWAAFFDRLGIEHEYEPFDLGKWSPDFLLPEWHALVEVKPTTDFDHAVFGKMRQACVERGLGDGEDPQVTSLILLSLAPRLVGGGRCQVGWWSDGILGDHGDAYLVWFQCHPSMVLEPQADVAAIEQDGWRSVGGNCGVWKEAERRHPIHVADRAREIWSAATGDVQWHKGRGS